ncbi:hypothetical protein [Streptomyces sp. NPDC088246]|uniref:hypothetical protein n=1 Tax=Streptomyces sp. NPDC088246 TaxID=3365842 RepID=UPI0038200962
MFDTAGSQRGPGVGIEAGFAPHEARWGGGGRHAQQREARGGRQNNGTFGPVRAVPFPPG